MACRTLGEGAHEYVHRCQTGRYARAQTSAAAMLELGSLIGALSSGLFADHFSRRQAIVTACSSSAIPCHKTTDLHADVYSNILHRIYTTVRSPSTSTSNYRTRNRWPRCWGTKVIEHYN